MPEVRQRVDDNTVSRIEVTLVLITFCKVKVILVKANLIIANVVRRRWAPVDGHLNHLL